MRKTLKLKNLSLLFLAVLAVALLSCNTSNQNGFGSHTHVWGEWYTVIDAECELGGFQDRKCECGETETRDISPLGHTEGDWILDVKPSYDSIGKRHKECVTCGETLFKEAVEVSESEGLKYVVNVDGKTCTITGKGKCKDTEIIIGSTIDGYTVTGIRERAFVESPMSGDTRVTLIKLPDTLVYIEPNAFAECEKLKKIIMPETLERIGYGAFSGCKSLVSIEIPNGVTEIESNTFYHCKSLKTVKIPSSVTKIAECAFQLCESLENITLPEGITSISESVFSGCRNLKNVKIPNTVTEIGGFAFSNCNALTEMIIPENVTTIGHSAFNSCTNLKILRLPKSLRVINFSAFVACSNLESVYVSDLESWCRISFGDLMSNPFYLMGTIHIDGKPVTDLVIPDGVTDVYNYAFAFTSDLRSAKIPEGVTCIGEGAFQHCENLTDVTIPTTVKVIGMYSFMECSKLRSVYYNGTTSEWNSIVKGISWKEGAPNFTVYCTNGTLKVG